MLINGYKNGDVNHLGDGKKPFLGTCMVLLWDDMVPPSWLYLWQDIPIYRERDLINSAWTHQMLVMVLVFRTWGYKWLVIDMIDILFLDVLHNMFVRYLTWYAHPLIDRMWLLDHPQQVATMKIGYDMTMKMVTFLATNESNQWLKAKICPVVHLQNMKSLYWNVWCKFLPVFWRKIQPFWSMLIHFLGSEQYSKFDPL